MDKSSMIMQHKQLWEQPEANTYSDAVHVYVLEGQDKEGSNETRTGMTITNVKLHVFCRNPPRSGQRSIVFLQTPPQAFYPSFDLLSKTFNIPDDYWTCQYQEANGYFGAYETRDANNTLERFETETRFLCKRNTSTTNAPVKTSDGIDYIWEKLAFWTSWQQDGSFIMLCFDLPAMLERHIVEKAKQSQPGRFMSPFGLHHLAVSAVVTNYDEAVWEWRDLIRVLEQLRPTKDDINGITADYSRMHELARHTTHSTENLETALETTLQLLDTARRLDFTTPDHKWSSTMIEHGLVRQSSLLKSLRHRSKALESRLASEIALVHNINSQHDSARAAQIAVLARQDSEITKTIAFLGLLFLPGTLVSAIFSTSFFNYNPGNDTTQPQWSVSSMFWLYWVVTGALTVTTLLVWTLWRRWSDIEAFFTRSRTTSMTTDRPLPLSSVNHRSRRSTTTLLESTPVKIPRQR